MNDVPVTGLTKLIEAIQALFVLISKNQTLAYIFRLLVILFFLWLIFKIGYRIFSVIMRRKERLTCKPCYEESQKRNKELVDILRQNASAIDQFNRQRGV